MSMILWEIVFGVNHFQSQSWATLLVMAMDYGPGLLFTYAIV